MAHEQVRLLVLLIAVAVPFSTLAQGSSGWCPDYPVGIANPDIIPDSQMTASSQLSDNFRAAYARLNRDGNGWCTQSGTSNNEWLQVDLGDTFDVCGFATQGHIRANAYIQSFKLAFSSDGINWTFYQDVNGNDMVLQRKWEAERIDQELLRATVSARYVRFYPVDYVIWTCLKVELFGFNDNPCSGQYTHLNTADRAQTFDDPSILLCDKDDLDPGWYRISGPAGDRMPEECVPDEHCGTHAPGWLDSTHPSVDDGTVTRQVCYNWESDCCEFSNNIQVRNCGAFYLYKLVKPPFCSLRYCGNGGGNTVCVEGSIVTDECGQECTCSGGELTDCTRIRREFTSMTTQEQQRYTAIVHTASTDPQYKTEYDRLITLHRTLFQTDIHRRDQFLPWHRWFILQYENLLRQVDCTFTVAYWDWSVVAQTPWRTEASDLWHGDFGFGGNGAGSSRCVTSGPFRQEAWNLMSSAGGGCLRRAFNRSPPDAVAVAEVLATAAGSFNDFEENLRTNLHDNVHCQIGGTMCSVDAATAPEFFLHHSFIDKIWMDWQVKSNDHLNAHFASVSEDLHGTDGLKGTQFLDSSSLPGNVRVLYRATENVQIGNVLQRLRSMPLSELTAIPRAPFSGLSQDAIDMFKIQPSEVKEARRLEKELMRFTGTNLPLHHFQPGSVEASLGFSLASVGLK